MTDKPLSETHPKLYETRDFLNFEGKNENLELSELGMYWGEESIQKTTVDMGEYERLKKENSLLEKAVKSLEAQSEKEQSDFITLFLEVERLKKEHATGDVIVFVVIPLLLLIWLIVRVLL